MPAFSAQLRVAGHVLPVLRCTYQTQQATDSRGRVNAKVRYLPVELLLDVPDHNLLLAWAADPHKRQAADIVFLNPATGSAIETLHLAAAYCVGYFERFAAGDAGTGAYQCHISLSDPDGFTLHVGGPVRAFVAPNARDHGVPAATVAALPSHASASSCPPAVTAALQRQVGLACKTVKSKCIDTDSCPLLVEKMALFEACITARETIMNQCFGGGDAGHQEQIQTRKNGVKKCEAIYLRQCTPRPQPVPYPRSAPSSAPNKRPSDDVLVPTTAAGVGLLILYILSSALRPGPI